MLASSMLLRVFDFRNDDPSYALAIKHTLTVEPKHLDIHVSLFSVKKLISGSSSEGSRVQEPQIDECVSRRTPQNR